MREKALEFPKSICLETYSLCNGACKFCPYPSIKDNKNILPDNLVYKLIDEISTHDIERFSLFNNNEPLLDNRIYNFIRYAKKKMPHIRQTLSSNGRLLSAEIIEKSINIGVDRFFISIPSLKSQKYGELMEYELESILHVIDSVKKSYYPYIRIAVPKTIYYDESEFYQQFISKGLKVITWGIEAKKNWTNYNDICNFGVIDYGCGCDRPLDQAIISANGDVLICCRDWYHENVFGNVKNNTIEEIWKFKSTREVQNKISRGEYCLVECCKTCSRTYGVEGESYA